MQFKTMKEYETNENPQIPKVRQDPNFPEVPNVFESSAQT